MLKPRYTAKFKKDFKVVVKRGCDTRLLGETLAVICKEQPLPTKYLDHPLTGNYTGHRECHITPDWLLIYKVEKENSILSLTRTGTHIDLL